MINLSGHDFNLSKKLGLKARFFSCLWTQALWHELSITLFSILTRADFTFKEKHIVN